MLLVRLEDHLLSFLRRHFAQGGVEDLFLDLRVQRELGADLVHHTPPFGRPFRLSDSLEEGFHFTGSMMRCLLSRRSSPLPRCTSRSRDADAYGAKRRRRTCWRPVKIRGRSEEHTSELQSLAYLVCRLLLEKKKTRDDIIH